MGEPSPPTRLASSRLNAIARPRVPLLAPSTPKLCCGGGRRWWVAPWREWWEKIWRSRVPHHFSCVEPVVCVVSVLSSVARPPPAAVACPARATRLRSLNHT